MLMLGDLERAVMEALWCSDSETVSVRVVVEELSKKRDVAYTTVLTVMDRLAKKGLLDRHLAGRAWQYSPRMTRTEYFASEIGHTLASVSVADQIQIVNMLHKRFRPAV